MKIGKSVTAAEGVNYGDVYVFAIESTSRDAVQCALGTRYEVEDYNDTWVEKTYSRFSTADCWVTNTTTDDTTIWETKARPDITIDTYQDGYFRVGKAAKLRELQNRHPEFPIYIGLIYPKDKAIVIYPLEELENFQTHKVKAWDPDKGKYVEEWNYLCPVSDIDRVHDAGGYVRHWHGCDWEEMYSYNERIGIELSAQGLI